MVRHLLLALAIVALMCAPLTAQGRVESAWSQHAFIAGGFAYAPALTLTWDASPDPVDGYLLRYGPTPCACERTIDAGRATSAVADGLKVGSGYYFEIRAYQNTGSGTAPAAPVKVRIVR